jgi:hypothetical protein
MAHLTCKNHGKRSMVLHPSKVVRHRSGTAECDSTEVVYAGYTLPKNFVTDGGITQPVERVAKRTGKEPKRKSRAKRDKEE